MSVCSSLLVFPLLCIFFAAFSLPPPPAPSTPPLIATFSLSASWCQGPPPCCTIVLRFAIANISLTRKHGCSPESDLCHAVVMQIFFITLLGVYVFIIILVFSFKLSTELKHTCTAPPTSFESHKQQGSTRALQIFCPCHQPS